jgi:hypothetical protein
MGLVLENVRSTKSWKFRNESFRAFLEEECIQESSAYLYMRVARRFFLELQIEDHVVAALASVSMNTLDVAAKIVTKENLEDVVAILTSLTDRDARAELEVLVPRRNGEAPSDQPAQLKKILALYRTLPEDQRIDFRNEVRLPGKTTHAGC